MRNFAGRRVLALHAGALGDFVLAWPLLRALQQQSACLRLIAASSHVCLARRVLGVDGVGNEHRQFGTLMHEPAPDVDRDWWHRVLGWSSCDLVIAFVGDGPALRDNVRRIFGAEEVIEAGAPGSESRRHLWEIATVGISSGVWPSVATTGRVVLHIGSGGRDKLWPLRNWCELSNRLRAAGSPTDHVLLLGGPVEYERLEPRDHALFQDAGGRFAMDLNQLVDSLTGAVAYVGADTGPTHLAAQLGVPTLALFGPTDPAVWGPVGPRVIIHRAADGRMASISVESAQSALVCLLSSAE